MRPGLDDGVSSRSFTEVPLPELTHRFQQQQASSNQTRARKSPGLRNLVSEETLSRREPTDAARVWLFSSPVEAGIANKTKEETGRTFGVPLLLAVTGSRRV